ncbi:MAG: DUF3857 domain-containing protein [Sphingobium sp.]|nr:DUF3857 domain-containing protein [Sphingobium sp.]
MSIARRGLSVLVAALWSSSALAGEVPLYQPAPDWVTLAALPDTKAGASSPPILIFDSQQRIAKDTLWTYRDSATRVSTTEMLNQLATLTLPWMPDKGDLIIHELAIIRGSERVDLLAQGKTFTVLRREQNLEQRELTGLLTATMAVEGLRVGDVLRLRYTSTVKDAALDGRVQSSLLVPSSPLRLGFGRARIQWEEGSAAAWKLLATGDAKPEKKGQFTELNLTLPLAKQPDMPGDAPARYQNLPLLEVSTFANWADVSRVMAPLYQTKDLIAEGSPLAAEADAIMKARSKPIERAQLALQLVQDKIRYLALGMNGGNYVPQKPTQTWDSRYGDCKAKTLLLLSLLHRMGIEAEPVVAHTELGDLVKTRLPAAGAFNHVIVRAVIDGESLWLDGTGLGSRLEDIHDTPPFRTVLPLRMEGADLMPVPMHANARPAIDLTIESDQTASLDLPSPFTATALVRGQLSSVVTMAQAQLDKERQDDIVRRFFGRFLRGATFSDLEIVSDPQGATATLKAKGVQPPGWRIDGKKIKLGFSRTIEGIAFAPQRTRAAWAQIPVATANPLGTQYHLRIRLPDGGKGYALEGEPDSNLTVAGNIVSRKTRLEGGVLSVDERQDSTGAEIPVDQIPVERNRLSVEAAKAPRIVAPANATRQWDLTKGDPKGATQVATAETIYAKAIADNVDEKRAPPLLQRAGLFVALGNREAALKDLDQAMGIEADLGTYLRRASVKRDLGDLAGAQADVDAARDLNPSDFGATVLAANIRGERGDVDGALALLDERIDLGGETKAEYQESKANVMGEYGDATGALALVEELLADKPQDGGLLNARCWIKGTRSVGIDTALADCVTAVERDKSGFAALDSRALMYFRLGRYQDALTDLNAVLELAPGLAESRYMRAVVLTALNRKSEAQADLAIARRIRPRIDVAYARYGIKP